MLLWSLLLETTRMHFTKQNEMHYSFWALKSGENYGHILRPFVIIITIQKVSKFLIWCHCRALKALKLRLVQRRDRLYQRPVFDVWRFRPKQYLDRRI